MATIIAIPVATMVIVLSIACVCSGGVSGAGTTETRVSAQELPYESSPAKVAIIL